VRGRLFDFGVLAIILALLIEGVDFFDICAASQSLCYGMLVLYSAVSFALIVLGAALIATDLIRNPLRPRV
jgi:hypothetical protein